MPLIEFIQIEKKFKQQQVIRGVDLILKERDFFGLLGKSGAGKTTLLRLLIGFYPLDNGKIMYQHQEVTTKTHLIRKAVGYCTQDNSFYPDLTVEENMHYYGKLYSIPRKILSERVSHLLHSVSLFEHRKKLAGALSGGMKRRLDLAIALVHDPDFLILDEPTTGLDPLVQTAIWDLISHINKLGKTILVSTHHLEYIEQRCNKVGILHNGYMVAMDSPTALMSQYHTSSLNDVFREVIHGVER